MLCLGVLVLNETRVLQIRLINTESRSKTLNTHSMNSFNKMLDFFRHSISKKSCTEIFYIPLNV